MAIVFGALGFLTTPSSIVLACVPAADEPNKVLAVVEDCRLVGRVGRDWCDRVCSQGVVERAERDRLSG